MSRKPYDLVVSFLCLEHCNGWILIVWNLLEYVSVYQNCFIQVSIESIIPEIILNCYIACHCVVLALCEKKKSVEF